jgi:hypothetical protein
MHKSKRIEQQIEGIQDKAETVKMEVCYARAFPLAMRCTDAFLDYTNTVIGAAVTTSGGSMMSGAYHKIQIRYPAIPIQSQHA